MPREVRTVGWNRFGPGPASDAGSAVLCGDVATRHHRDDVAVPAEPVG